MRKKRKKKQAVSRLSNSTGLNGSMLLAESSPFAVKEAYIKLRTNLMFCMTKNKEQSCRIFAVTSANQNEGKSISAANIAVSFALLGKKTLLIDADMRKSTQQKIWGIKKTVGLCDFLAGLGACERYQIEAMPLSLICTGTVPPNPAELLASQKMKALITNMCKDYDYIIVDTPPVNVVADAQILSSYVDGFIIVARSGKTESGDLILAVNTLLRAEGNLCGVLLNGLDLKAGRYSYGCKYGEGYGYSGSYEGR